MIDYDVVLGELHQEADRIQAAITALTALASRQDVAEPAAVAPRTQVRASAQPPAPKAARKPRKAKAVRAAKGDDWKAKATALRMEGMKVVDIAKQLGKHYQTVYGWLSPRAARTPKVKAASQPAVFRCQECGQKGTDPTRCDHCMEKRAA